MFNWFVGLIPSPTIYKHFFILSQNEQGHCHNAHYSRYDELFCIHASVVARMSQTLLLVPGVLMQVLCTFPYLKVTYRLYCNPCYALKCVKELLTFWFS